MSKRVERCASSSPHYPTHFNTWLEDLKGFLAFCLFAILIQGVLIRLYLGVEVYRVGKQRAA